MHEQAHHDPLPDCLQQWRLWLLDNTGAAAAAASAAAGLEASMVLRLLLLR
jgi:hypothetical protein